MIKQVFIFLSLFFTSCNCVFNHVNEKPFKKISISSCPIEGKCTATYIENKSLEIKFDDTGAIYYELNNNFKTSVIKFEYNKTIDTTLQDNFYNEELLFEIPNQFEEINLIDNELESVKMLFGKHCFCRGQTGIYKIKKGKLNLKREEKTTSFNLKFEIQNIDHTIKNISEIIK